MNLSCNLFVDGSFEGVIESNTSVTVGKNGNIKGDITAKQLVVQGYIEGSINASIVEIKSVGRVNGSIEAGELVIEAKGVFEGSSIVKDSTTSLTSEKLRISKS